MFEETMNETIFNSANQNPLDLAKLNTPKTPSLSGKNHAELKKVAEEFEAIFIAQLLKIMRETIEESGMEGGGFGKGIYTELFDQEVAVSMARRGALGIGDIIYKSLVENETADDAGLTAAASLPGRTISSPAPKNFPTPKNPNVSPAPDAAASGDAVTSGDAAASELDIFSLRFPVNAPVSSAFGMRKDPFTGTQKFHKGIDLAAPAGTPVVAALPGKVIAAGNEPGYGNMVLVEHDGGLRTRYGHLASINVKAGDKVTSEDVLGKVGNTGRSTGAHLHFEVIRDGESIDPAKITVFVE